MPSKKMTARWSPSWRTTLSDYVISFKEVSRSEMLAAVCGSGGLFGIESLSGEILWKTSAHEVGAASLEALDSSTDLLLTGGQDGYVRGWQASTGRKKFEVRLKGYSVDHLCISPDRDLIAAACDRNLYLLDLDGKIVKTFAPARSSIAGLCWTPKTKKLVTTCYGGVQLWEVDRDEPEEILPWKGSTVCLALSPTVEWIACGTQDLGVHVWNTRTKEDLEMSGYPLKVKSLSWNFEGRYLATGGGAQITIWDFSGKGPAGTTPRVLEGHADVITALSFDSNDNRLISGDQSGECLMWNLSESEPTLGLTIEEPITQIQWSSDKKNIFVSGAKGSIVRMLAVLEPE